MRKVTVELSVKLTLNMNDDVELEDVINELDYNFVAGKDSGADVADSEIEGFEVRDSR